MNWGKLPYIVVKKRKLQLKKKIQIMVSNANIGDNKLMKLKEIANGNPNLYLDKILLYFGIKTGKHYVAALFGSI